MAPQKRKGEQPIRQAAADEAERKAKAPRVVEEDPREEDGWTQPESSAQKAPSSRPEPE
jgi:hypothetical protein